MQKGNLNKWSNIQGCINLLFFAELVNELLFDYSIPSNRVATLNSHYLCVDALSAINGIESNGVPEGTLKPIMEELYVSLQKDPAFDDADKPLNYFVKYQNERYRISTNVSELNYDELKKTAQALNARFFEKDQYYQNLKSKIIDIVVNNQVDEQPCLFRLVKSLLTELINTGYSKRYIYTITNEIFWSPCSNVDSPTLINCFFDRFTFEKHEFSVVFVVNKTKISTFINYMEDLHIENQMESRTTSPVEKSFLRIRNEQGFLEIKRQAVDPFSAAESAKTALSINAAFYRLCDHDYRYDIRSAKCGVYDERNFYKVVREKSAVSHTKMPSKKQIIENMEASEKALKSMTNKRNYRDYLSMINATLFHSQSLDSTSEENQLLDLWAIFESVLNISNKHTSDRIQQVCMHLIPILKRKYLFSLFLQLVNDIKNYSESEYSKIVGNSTDEAEIVQKVCEFIVLEENQGALNIFLQNCTDFPLLKERMEYYAKMFRTPFQVYEFVEKHAECVKWQIMRIYRNRNLIVHNGDTMPYVDLLIENLHSYVDDFLTYTTHNLAKGHTINSMCQELFAKECEWIADFSNKKAEMNLDMVMKMLSL